MSEKRFLADFSAIRNEYKKLDYLGVHNRDYVKRSIMRKAFSCFHNVFSEIKPNDSFFILTGMIDIIDEDGCSWGIFSVDLLFPTTYPNGFPDMIENRGFLPKTPERHVNIDGTCCVCIEPIRRIEVQRGITIKRFIEFFALPFFANQLYFDKYKKYPYGDYSHGNCGIVEYYQELFDTQDNEEIKKGFDFFLLNQKWKNNSHCYCGSHRKISNCHHSVLQTLSVIGQQSVLQHQKLF